MPKTSPWHSTKEAVHHDNTTCGPGGQITPANKQSGTGGKPLCQDCAKHDKDGK